MFFVLSFGKYLIQAECRKYQNNNGIREQREAVSIIELYTNTLKLQIQTNTCKSHGSIPLSTTISADKHSPILPVTVQTDVDIKYDFDPYLQYIFVQLPPKREKDFVRRQIEPLYSRHFMRSSARRRVHVVTGRERERASSTPKLPQQTVRYLLLVWWNCMRLSMNTPFTPLDCEFSF